MVHRKPRVWHRIPPDLGGSKQRQSGEYGVHARETTREEPEGDGCSPWRESLFAIERLPVRHRGEYAFKTVCKDYGLDPEKLLGAVHVSLHPIFYNLIENNKEGINEETKETLLNFV